MLIECTDELRATMNEALALKRNHVAGSMYMFCNIRGQRTPREAEKRNTEFKKFSLQDCRPKGVGDKLSSGQTDSQEATGHTSERMIRQVYDHRAIKKAKPVQ